MDEFMQHHIMGCKGGLWLVLGLGSKKALVWLGITLHCPWELWQRYSWLL
jgi:hypothetical protein